MHNLYTIIKSILALKTKLIAKEPSVTNTDRNTFYMFTYIYLYCKKKKKKSALSGFKGMGYEDMNIFVFTNPV